jgi:hypothetical protein
MSILVTGAASTHNLVTDANIVADLGLSPADTTVARLIAQASAQIRSYCGRVFAEERVTESLPGQGRQRLQLARVPVAVVHGVTFEGTVITDFTVHDLLKGQLYRRAGWLWTVGGFSGEFPGGYPAEALPDPRSAENLYAVDYTAGYWLPTFVGSPPASSHLLPEDVKLACELTVKQWYRERKGGIAGQRNSIATPGVRVGYGAGSVGEQVRASTGLPVEAAAILQPYVELGVA